VHPSQPELRNRIPLGRQRPEFFQRKRVIAAHVRLHSRLEIRLGSCAKHDKNTGQNQPEQIFSSSHGHRLRFAGEGQSCAALQSGRRNPVLMQHTKET